MLFMSLLGAAFLGLLLYIPVSVRRAYRRRETLKPVEYLHYNRSAFDRTFTFACEYCASAISNREETCPHCGGSYRRNAEYQAKKKAVDLAYLDYLETQKQKIAQETDYIERTMTTLKRNLVMKRTFYNFELGKVPVYRPSAAYEFTCDFCGTRLHGRKGDGLHCPHCGAGCEENLELKICEAQDQLDKLHYDEYVRLKAVEKRQNRINGELDEVTTRNARGIATAILLGFVVLAGLVTLLVLWLAQKGVIPLLPD